MKIEDTEIIPEYGFSFLGVGSSMKSATVVSVDRKMGTVRLDLPRWDLRRDRSWRLSDTSTIRVPTPREKKLA